MAPSRRTRLAYRIIVFAAFFVPLGGTSSALAEDAVTVGVAGGEDILWVFQRRPEPDGSLLVRFAYRSADARPPVHFAPLGMTPVRGGIRHAVVLNRYVHIFYRDGTHKKYRPSSYVSDPWSSAVQTDERILPNSTVPLALASDEQGAALFALLSAREARELTAPTRSDDSLPPDEPTVPMLYSHRGPEQTVIARYFQGRWIFDRPGPPGLTPAATPSALWARNGRLHLIYPSTNHELLTAVSEGSAGDWTTPEALPFDQPPVQLAAVWQRETPVLLYAERVQTDMRVGALFLEENRWTPGPVLRDEQGAEARFVHPLGFGSFQTWIAVAALDHDGNVQVGLWSSETGEPVEALSMVTPLVRRAPADGRGFSALWLQYVILATLLIGVFTWRRVSPMMVVPVASDRQLAPLMKRLAALLIDLTLLFPVWGPLIFMQLLAEGSGTWQSFMLTTPDGTITAADWFRPILGGVFGLYGAILEGLFGATLGKRINGLAVVDHRGMRARFTAILIRNAARILEFNYPPLCLLVVMTPARQRIGDILAQTVVLSSERTHGNRIKNQEEAHQ